MITTPLEQGDVLRGRNCTFRIEEQLGGGGAGITFRATILDASADVPELTRGREVVVKAPRVDSGLTRKELASRLGELLPKQLNEKFASKSLQDLDCVATVFDHADFSLIGEKGRSNGPWHMVIQEYIPGPMLSKYIERQHPGKEQFSGVPDAETFFAWARQIVTIVRSIHQRQVVHGDLWQNNIIVRNNVPSDLVLIDFGQAAFREEGLARGGETGGSWRPSEGSGSTAGDVFSLGGLLLYLAAGSRSEERPPRGLEPESARQYVADRILERNANLLDSNCGIVDIIARCLRSREYRPQSATDVLHDIELFETPTEPQGKIEPLIVALRRLEQQNPLIAALATHGINRLSDQIVDLTHGVLDMKGGREDFVIGLTRVVAQLGRGDQYLTISTPTFWSAKNVGRQGRFLSANRQAVLHRGAIIKRLFLITEAELVDPDFKKTIEVQTEIADAVRSGRFRDAGEYEIRYEIVLSDRREEEIRDGMNFGLLIKGQKRLLLSLDYVDSTINAVEFRENQDLARKFEKIFDARFSRGKPSYVMGS
jgi:serine/threonine protein kinase